MLAGVLCIDKSTDAAISRAGERACVVPAFRPVGSAVNARCLAGYLGFLAADTASMAFGVACIG